MLAAGPRPSCPPWVPIVISNGMRRASLVVVILGACSGRPPRSTLTTPAPAPAPAAGPVLADLIPAGATGIARGDAASFPIFGFWHSMFASAVAPCWPALEARLTAGYQVEIRSRQSSVFVFEGDLPRDQVEACARLVLSSAPVPFTVRRDGELTVIDGGSLGAAHAAWRGRFIVAGRRDLVLDALAGPPGNAWSTRLAALPPAPLAVVSSDALFGNVLRIPTTGWDLVLDELGRPSQPALRGRVLVHATTAADAALAARRLAGGDLWAPVAIPPSLIAALRKLRTSVHDRELELDFDLATFQGVDMAEMSQLADQVRAIQPAPPP